MARTVFANWSWAYPNAVRRLRISLCSDFFGLAKAEVSVPTKLVESCWQRQLYWYWKIREVYPSKAGQMAPDLREKLVDIRFHLLAQGHLLASISLEENITTDVE